MQTKPQLATMTYGEFDSFMEYAEKIELFNHQPYWPNAKEIAFFAEKFPTKETALFLQWLIDANGEPHTVDEKASLRTMQHFVNQSLELVDDSSPLGVTNK